LNFVAVEPWPKNKGPKAPPGFAVTRYAENLEHPRWMYRLPNGDILVSESATLPKGPDDPITQRLIGWLQRNSGAVAPSPNKIVLLRDADGDGVVDTETTFLTGLNQPFGIVLVGGHLYVANTDSVVRFPYKDGDTEITAKGEKILDLPAGGYNNHWTRNVVANADGTKLYVTVGSGSNAGENGLDNEKRRADILEINPDGTGERVFASGLRNPNGLAFEPQTHVLWTAVNERDLLGDDLVPDYLTRVRAGDFYGWPYSYWGKHVDDRVSPARPDLVAKALAPDYALGAHTASLGLVFYDAAMFGAHFAGGAFIGQHGSWNRSYFSGYKVIFVPFKNGMPDGTPEDFLTGFMPEPNSGKAYGRPVGVAIDRTGALLVADDTGNIIWRVAKAK
jgi:glucose/arabinose dehydrogenase